MHTGELHGGACRGMVDLGQIGDVGEAGAVQ
jgi:hypothetical protein